MICVPEKRISASYSSLDIQGRENKFSKDNHNHIAEVWSHIYITSTVYRIHSMSMNSWKSVRVLAYKEIQTIFFFYVVWRCFCLAKQIRRVARNGDK